MFWIEFFSKSTLRIAVFVCKSKNLKERKGIKILNGKQNYDNDIRRRHRWRKSQVFQLYIDRRSADSSKTRSITEKFLSEKIFDLKMRSFRSFFKIVQSRSCHSSDIHTETKTFFGFQISMTMLKNCVEIIFDSQFYKSCNISLIN
jgi:hypothetical protein